ncbi:unnamed protein product [Trichobilharzia regenti]|nr:unnamed protein product [Trichobilharzia regenti]
MNSSPTDRPVFRSPRFDQPASTAAVQFMRISLFTISFDKYSNGDNDRPFYQIRLECSFLFALHTVCIIHVVFLFSKTAISIWRNCGRAIISEGKNQQDLNLWRAYAKGFWQISQDLLITATLQDVKIPIEESRRILDSALTMYPIPEDFGPSLKEDMHKLTDFYQNTYTPRLKLLQDYVDLEMDVCPGSGSCLKGFNEETRVLHLLTYAAIGGAYTAYTESSSEIMPTVMVKTNYRFGKRIEAIWTTLVGLSEVDTNQNSDYQQFLSALISSVPIICYLNLMFDLLTADQKVVDYGLVLFCS